MEKWFMGAGFGIVFASQMSFWLSAVFSGFRWLHRASAIPLEALHPTPQTPRP